MNIIFSDLFSIIVFWQARKTRRVILYNLRQKSDANLNFWWSYGNFSPRLLTVSLRRVHHVFWNAYTVFLSKSKEIGNKNNYLYVRTCPLNRKKTRRCLIGNLIHYQTPSSFSTSGFFLRWTFVGKLLLASLVKATVKILKINLVPNLGLLNLVLE
jgi:hypothetical protein